MRPRSDRQPMKVAGSPRLENKAARQSQAISDAADESATTVSFTSWYSTYQAVPAALIAKFRIGRRPG